MKNRTLPLLAATLVTTLTLLATAAPAYASVDRAVVDSISGGYSGVNGQLIASIHLMDGSTEVFPNSIPFLIGTSTTNAQLSEAADAAIISYATGAGYTLTNGIVWPYLSPDQTTSLIASSAPQSMVFATSTRSLNTAFQISTTRASFASYSVDIASTLSLTTGQTGTVQLQYADNSAFTTNVVTVQSAANGNTGSLTIGLNLIQTSTASVTGMIPAGKWVRLATVNTTGTPTFTFRAAQEVLMPSN